MENKYELHQTDSESEDSVPLNKFLDESEESDSVELPVKQIKVLSRPKSVIGNRPLTDYLFVSNKTYNFLSWTDCFPNKMVSLRSLVFNPAWNDFFDSIEKKPYFKNMEKILSKYLTDKNRTIVPPAELVFNSFNVMSPKQINVVFIGQDPYPGILNIDGKNIPNAMGFSFSIPIGHPKSESLNNIYQNLKLFKHIKEIPEGGCLSTWVLQGCFMINASLTTIVGERNIHKNLWANFTNDLISYLSSKLSNTVFVVWGGPAHRLCKNICPKTHFLTTSSHPSPLSAHATLNGLVYGNIKNESKRKNVTYPAFKKTDHFGNINTYLASVNKKKILWDLFF